jgi:hypothetical protein
LKEKRSQKLPILDVGFALFAIGVADKVLDKGSEGIDGQADAPRRVHRVLYEVGGEQQQQAEAREYVQVAPTGHRQHRPPHPQQRPTTHSPSSATAIRSWVGGRVIFSLCFRRVPSQPCVVNHPLRTHSASI